MQKECDIPWCRIYITILNFVEEDRTRIVFTYRVTKERELESVVKREASLQPATSLTKTFCQLFFSLPSLN